MVNFIIEHSKLIVGICVILFGLATIPISLMVLGVAETSISNANMFDYFIWFTSSVLILSGIMFTLFGGSLIEDYARGM